jgi:RNase P/RNase MRP subunit POP5
VAPKVPNRRPDLLGGHRRGRANLMKRPRGLVRVCRVREAGYPVRAALSTIMSAFASRVSPLAASGTTKPSDEC